MPWACRRRIARTGFTNQRNGGYTFTWIRVSCDKIKPPQKYAVVVQLKHNIREAIAGVLEVLREQGREPDSNIQILDVAV
jgi:hypothetical protein